MKALDVPVIAKTYELYKSLYLIQKNIPKLERYTLWQDIQKACLAIIKYLVHGGYLDPNQRINVLTEASIKVDLLKLQLRLAFDTKIINQKKYISLQSQIDEIGRMLGGWIKSIKQKQR